MKRPGLACRRRSWGHRAAWTVGSPRVLLPDRTSCQVGARLTRTVSADPPWLILASRPGRDSDAHWKSFHEALPMIANYLRLIVFAFGLLIGVQNPAFV